MDKPLVKEPIYSLRSPGGAGKCGKHSPPTTPGAAPDSLCPALLSFTPTGFRSGLRLENTHREAAGCFVLQFPRG
jgi:hypothetical protein